MDAKLLKIYIGSFKKFFDVGSIFLLRAEQNFFL